MKTNIAGLKVDFLTKAELFKLIDQAKATSQTIWLTTLYSEFLYRSLKNRATQELLNSADLSLPDGVGIFWAKEFLNTPLKTQNIFLRVLLSVWQAIKTLLTFKSETIPGSLLVWDLGRWALENDLCIFLLGGFDQVPEITAKRINEKFENKLYIYFSNKNPNDTSVIEEIKKVKPDILFVAYGPVKQEQWIYENKKHMPFLKLVVGLGGTFDYIAGNKIFAPKLLRKLRLEWLWRLVTQPYRIKRILQATFGLIYELIKYKVSLKKVE